MTWVFYLDIFCDQFYLFLNMGKKKDYYYYYFRFRCGHSAKVPKRVYILSLSEFFFTFSFLV